MPRILALIILVVGMVATISFAVTGHVTEDNSKDKRTETNWQPIIELSDSKFKTFIDVNSLHTYQVNERTKFTAAVILISFKDVTELKNEKGTYKVRGAA